MIFTLVCIREYFIDHSFLPITLKGNFFEKKSFSSMYLSYVHVTTFTSPVLLFVKYHLFDQLIILFVKYHL